MATEDGSGGGGGGKRGAAGAGAALSFQFVQSFGDDQSSDDDRVTCVQFDHTGDYLAVGDKAGRVCIFEALPDDKTASNIPIEYAFYTEFQSHEPEFDCLKSLEIEEKINMIQWVERRNNGLFLLATNDKTIRFWKVHERRVFQPPMLSERLLQQRGGSGGGESNRVPRIDLGLVDQEEPAMITATPKRVFANAHGYHINSISANSDGETFISADDLRVNLWNLEISSESFNILDVKPPNLEELTEVITSATFHPQHCHTLMYSSSRGSIRLGDLRESALCDQHSKLFEIEEDPANKSFFSEIISSISDAKFTADGRYIVSRDYLTIKIWDVNMESKPVHVIPVHEYLKSHLCDLYENDCIFDKFECAASSDGLKFVSGSYNNNFVLYDSVTKSSLTVECLKDPPRRKHRKDKKGKKKKSKQPETPNVNLMDFGKKALHVDWHPRLPCVAIAGLNKLYIYAARKSSSSSSSHRRRSDHSNASNSSSSNTAALPALSTASASGSVSASSSGGGGATGSSQ